MVFFQPFKRLIFQSHVVSSPCSSQFDAVFFPTIFLLRSSHLKEALSLHVISSPSYTLPPTPPRSFIISDFSPPVLHTPSLVQPLVLIHEIVTIPFIGFPSLPQSHHQSGFYKINHHQLFVLYCFGTPFWLQNLYSISP